MNEVKRDLVGKLAWNIVRMEFAEERKDRERLANLSADFDQLAAKLNDLCNAPKESNTAAMEGLSNA